MSGGAGLTARLATAIAVALYPDSCRDSFRRLSVSTAIVGDGGVTGTGPVLSIPGVRGRVSPPSCRNGDGNPMLGAGWSAVMGLTISAVTSTSSSVLFFCDRPRLEQLAEQWNTREAGNFAQRLGDLVVEQSSDDKALAALHFNLRLDLACGQRRNVESLVADTVSIIETADFRSRLPGEWCRAR